MDANDTLYAFEASRDYNPEPDLSKITAPMVAVNSADDYLNPPSLGIIDRDIKRVKNGRYVLVPASDQTRGHFTALQANLWESNLTDLLNQSEH
jgi:homoserine O-acetyltransferase